MSTLTLADLGVTAVEESALPAEHARRLAATLGVPFDVRKPLPLLWHWAFFNAAVDTRSLGSDGHPRRDSALLTEFPRRMWVGGEVRRHGELHIDVPAVRRTHLATHVRKHGSAGDLLVVTFEHTVEQQDRVVVVERQDVIYRQQGGPTEAPGPPVDPPSTPGWIETVVPTTTMLFRFSAVTFNGHRIHYDRDYATNVEQYPSLVVHGPLTAMLLAGSASRHLGAALQSFTYRASSPIFVDQPVHLGGTVDASSDGAKAELTAIRSDGVAAMTAAAIAIPRR